MTCLVHDLMWVYLTQHGHQCDLIWMNIGNLPNTPHISKLKTVLWKYSYIIERAIPIGDFVGDQPRIISNLGHRGGTYPPGRAIFSLNTQSYLYMPLTGQFVYATHWTIHKEIQRSQQIFNLSWWIIFLFVWPWISMRTGDRTLVTRKGPS